MKSFYVRHFVPDADLLHQCKTNDVSGITPNLYWGDRTESGPNL